MKQVTPEQMYQSYLDAVIMKTKSVLPRRITNFDKQRSSPDWFRFVKLANLVNAKDGALDFRIYFKSLVDHYEGYVPPSEVCTMKSFKIYRTSIDIINAGQAFEKAERSALDSMKFVVGYCADNRITTFDDYLNSNRDLIPDILKHYSAGSVTVHFLALFPEISGQMSCYPEDCVAEFFKKADLDAVKAARSRLMTSVKWRKISDNFDVIMDKAIESGQKNLR